MIEGISNHNSLPIVGEPDDIVNAMARPLVDGGMTSHSDISEIRRLAAPPSA